MHPPPAPPTTEAGHAYGPTARGIAVASVGLGYFSLIVFFWKPFGMILAAVGLVLGLTSLAVGNKGGLRGENLALAGVGICGFSLAVTTTIYAGLGAVMWQYYPW